MLLTIINASLRSNVIENILEEKFENIKHVFE
jgi:hypothetical protein